MLRALASVVAAYLSEAIVVVFVVAAVVVIAREGRGANATAVEFGDTATVVLTSHAKPSSANASMIEPQLDPPVIEIPTGYESRRIYRTPDLDHLEPRSRPAWTGNWF